MPREYPPNTANRNLERALNMDSMTDMKWITEVEDEATLCLFVLVVAR